MRFASKGEASSVSQCPSAGWKPALLRSRFANFGVKIGCCLQACVVGAQGQNFFPKGGAFVPEPPCFSSKKECV